MKYQEEFFFLKFLLGVDQVELDEVTVFGYFIRNALTP